MKVEDALARFMARSTASYPRLLAPFDPEWRSPCEVGEPFDSEEGRLIAWQPLPRHPDAIAQDFRPLEQALDIEVHPDIKAYYGAYWSAGLEAEAGEGHVSLLFLWNQEDVARLNENLIGHAFSLGLRASGSSRKGRGLGASGSSRKGRGLGASASSRKGRGLRASEGSRGGRGLRTRERTRRPMSIFFACTEPDSELFLSVDNDSGTVLLERPGRGNVRQVAPSLAEFLEELVPAPPVPRP